MFGPKYQWKWRIHIFAIAMVFASGSVYDLHFKVNEVNEPKTVYAKPEHDPSAKPFTGMTSPRVNSPHVVSQARQSESNVEDAEDDYVVQMYSELALDESPDNDGRNPTPEQIERSRRIVVSFTPSATPPAGIEPTTHFPATPTSDTLTSDTASDAQSLETCCPDEVYLTDSATRYTDWEEWRKASKAHYNTEMALRQE